MKLDKNFHVETEIQKEDLKFYDIKEAPFQIYGVVYENALEKGNQNVYYIDSRIDSRTLMRMAGNEGTVDTCHPNDLGFASMALAVGDVLKNLT